MYCGTQCKVCDEVGLAEPEEDISTLCVYRIFSVTLDLLVQQSTHTHTHSACLYVMLIVEYRNATLSGAAQLLTDTNMHNGTALSVTDTDPHSGTALLVTDTHPNSGAVRVLTDTDPQ